MTDRTAKPFLKWAGGKTQLINDIEKVLPKDLYKNKFTYVEPFERVDARRSINANPENFYLGVLLSGRAIRSKSSLRYGLSTSIPNATYCF